MNKTNSLPRGIRNKNPLNIKRGCNWTGLVRDGKCDSTFATFKEFKYGWRAASLLLSKYYVKYGLNTVNKIIHRWCPDFTADSYANFVATQLGISKDFTMSKLVFIHKLRTLMLTMAVVECNRESVFEIWKPEDIRYALVAAQIHYFGDVDMLEFYED